MNVIMTETLQVQNYLKPFELSWSFEFNKLNILAHLAAMEGNLPCLKYLLSNATNANSLIAARNDQVNNKTLLKTRPIK